MKRAFFGLALLSWLGACRNDGQGGDTTDTTGAHTPAIENVNGNIPDTINTIPLQDNDDTSQRSEGDKPTTP